MLIEGSFRELVEEFSDYIDNIKATQEASSSLRSDVTPLLDALTKAEEASDAEAAEKARDEVLKVLVPKTDALNSAPEKGIPR
jgi:translation initiation factor 3 subunit M